MAVLDDILKENRLVTSIEINAELSKIIALLLTDFISTWYSALSDDQDLYREIVQAIAKVTQELERRLIKVEWIELLVHDLPTLLKQHIRDFRDCCSKLGTSYSGDRSLEELFYGMQPHSALKDGDSEREYMRRVSEVITESLIPLHELQSDGMSLLIRDLLCNNLLMTLMHTFSDPTFIYESILKIIDPGILESDNSYTNNYQDESDCSQNNLNEETTDDILIDDLETDDDNVAQQQHSDSVSTLFRVKQGKQISNDHKNESFGAAISSALNKITFGGFERVSSGITKIKDTILNPELLNLDSKRRRREKFNRSLANVKSTTKSIGERRGSSSFKSQGKHRATNIEKFDRMETHPRSGVPAIKSHEINQASNNDSVKTPELAHAIGEDITPITHLQPEASSKWSVIQTYHDFIGVIFLAFKSFTSTQSVDSKIYEKYHLDESLLGLLTEALQIKGQRLWFFVQLQYFFRPIIYVLGGSMINRTILRAIRSITSEASISYSLQCFRNSFWPNNVAAAACPIKSELEQHRIRSVAEQGLEKIFLCF